MGEPRIGAATIVARNYVPAARVLAESFHLQHPAIGFTVLVIDADDDELAELNQSVDTVRFIGVADIDLDPDDFGRMAMVYNVTELSTAVKPWLLTTLLTDHDVALYLDPDIEVFAPFATTAGELAVEHGIVLTPHVLAPMPRDGLRPTEADIMGSGVFNLGFIAVGTTAGPFLSFWAERLRQYSVSSIAEQLFTDQRWVDNVPALFSHTVVTDPGWNVAYWNVYQRPLARSADGTITADGQPLRFAHYSGYRPEQPWLASIHFADRPRVLLSEQPVFAELLAGYRSKLVDAGYRQALSDIPYRWDRLSDGTPVRPALRAIYRDAWIEAERLGTDLPPVPIALKPRPGEDDPTERLLTWAAQPATVDQQRAGLSRWAMATWHRRSDLQLAYPHPLHADAEDFRAWCASWGVDEDALPIDAIAERPVRGAVAPTAELGVNVLGYLTAELGVGELGRLVHEAVVASGVPVATTTEESTVVSRTDHPFPADAGSGEPRHGVSLLVVNADETEHVLRLYPDLARDRYVIGVWSWELDTFPETMHHAFAHTDEIWTNSDFCARAVRRVSPVPVYTFPIPVRDPRSFGGERIAPAPGEPIRFLFAFDHNSLFARKNPVAAITAFHEAFPARDDVELVIKSVNGDRHPGDRERLRLAASSDDRIELIEDYLDASEVAALFASVHAYVSPHRSEGFGLTVAEAMAHALAVVATDYGGTREFLTADTGWPVPYEMVPVGPGSQPYPADAQWAEPDAAALAAALREIADDPAGALQRGAAAREHVLATRAASSAAEWARERIEQAYGTWLRGRTEPPEAPVHRPRRRGPMAPLRRARKALDRRADPRVASSLPLAPALRRAVLRVLDHHDQHQRQVLDALLNGVEGSTRKLIERQRDLRGRLEQVEEARARTDDLNLPATLQDLSRLLAAQREDLRRASAELAAQASARDDLEQRLLGLHHERVEWMTNLEATTAALDAELPRLRTGLQRHHDLLDPPPEGTQIVLTDLGPLRLPAQDNVMAPWMRQYGDWESAESELIGRLLPEGGTFVDIGAHVGYFTVLGLRRVGASGRVLAVEPWQRGRDLLAHNVAANVPPAVAPALTVVDAAAWDADGPLRLSLDPDGNTGDNRIDPAGTLEVPGVRLDAVLAGDDRRVDVVKCDAQGRDQHALAGMVDVLAASRPHVLVEFDPAAIEEAGDDPVKVLATYRGWGYELVCIGDGDGMPDMDAPSQQLESGDAGLVDTVRTSENGFVTLWLRPLA